MEFDWVAIVNVLELISVVFYGFFIIIVIRIEGQGPFKLYLLHFCLVNWVLNLIAVSDAYPKEYCKLRGIATMFAFTMGMDSLRRSFEESFVSSKRNFRFFNVNSRFHWNRTLQMWAVSVVSAFLAWNFYSESSTAPKCFLSVEVPEVGETFYAIAWIAVCYLRHLLVILRSSPHLMAGIFKQVKQLQREKQLRPSQELFLYKDHLMRLGIVCFSVACMVVTVTWTLCTLPMLIKILNLIVGVNGLINEAVMETMFYYLHSFLPLSTCIVLCLFSAVYCFLEGY